MAKLNAKKRNQQYGSMKARAPQQSAALSPADKSRAVAKATRLLAGKRS